MRRATRWLLRTVPVFLAGVALAAPSDDGQPADIQFSKQAKLSPQETVTKAKDYRTQMEDARRDVLKMQDEALKKKDVIKLNCVNDKLEQIKGHITVADKSLISLNDAVSKSDDGERQHEFTRLTILSSKVDGLRTEAKGCIGDDIVFFGNERTSIEIDPSITATDPTENVAPTLEPVPRPTEASPAT